MRACFGAGLLRLNIPHVHPLFTSTTTQHHNTNPCLQVARRVHVQAPDSALFSVRRAVRGGAGSGGDDDGGGSGGRDEGSKVAPGMEVSYTVTFQPQGPGDASHALVVATERERFLVPLVGAGAAPALDLPDAIAFREAPPTRSAARQAVLVRNVGTAVGGFALSASGPFSVAPARGFLAPGESLQAVVAFSPPAAGAWEGELEVRYDSSGRATYTRLSGEGRELDVSLSASEVDFLPTDMGRLSQKSVWVVNNGDRPVAFALKQRPSAQDDWEAARAALVAAGGAPEGVSGGSSPTAGRAFTTGGSGGRGCPLRAAAGTVAASTAGRFREDAPPERDIDSTPRSSADSDGDAGTPGSSNASACAGLQAAAAAGGDAGGLTAEQSTASCAAASVGAASSSSAGDALLADASLAAAREAKRLRRDAEADAALFSSPHFAAFPPCGVVQPGGSCEVVLQFSPDHARDFDAVAFVEADGREARMPLRLCGRGLGPVACFSFDTLDVGNAFVNTMHQYELELMNRGRVDAEFRLTPSHTKWVVRLRNDAVLMLLLCQHSWDGRDSMALRLVYAAGLRIQVCGRHSCTLHFPCAVRQVWLQVHV